MKGLCSKRKYIPSVFFYDDTGCRLFEEITRLPEYYLASAEKEILNAVAPQVSAHLQNTDVVEIGSGDSSKIALLLRAVPHASLASLRYIPFDISFASLSESCEELSREFPEMRISGIAADFKRLELIPRGRKKVICFFGSTLGNLPPSERRKYLVGLSRLMNRDDKLLLGVDMDKSKEMLERAYNDAQGVTARFNKNVLDVANRLIGTDFDPLFFGHLAFYDQRRRRIEMHLEALTDMRVGSPCLSRPIALKKGQTIHTENSYKFTCRQISCLAAQAGLKIEQTYSDTRKLFSLVCLSKGMGF